MCLLICIYSNNTIICLRTSGYAAAIALSILPANVAICKLTVWGMHKTYKKHKIHLEGEMIRHPSPSPLSA